MLDKINEVGYPSLFMKLTGNHKETSIFFFHTSCCHLEELTNICGELIYLYVVIEHKY